MSEPPKKKFRCACDQCHRAKIKCSGGKPCTGCVNSGSWCVYRESNRAGRPKGTKNKRTLELTKQHQVDSDDRTDGKTATNKSGGSRDNAITNGNTTDGVAIQSTFASHPLPPPPQSTQPTVNSPIGPEDSDKASNMFSKILADMDDVFWDTCGSKFSGDAVFDAAPSSSLITPPSPKIADSFLSFYGNDPISHTHTYYCTDSSGTGDKSSSSDEGLPHSYSSETNLFLDERQTSSGDLRSLHLISMPEMPQCDCLQRHADLLCRLKELWQRRTPPPIDVALSGVHQVLAPWKDFVQCQVCDGDDDHEVLLLSTMSLRAVLRLLQSICSEQGGASPGLSVGNFEITGEERILVFNLLLSKTLDKVQFAIESLKARSLDIEGRRTVSIWSSWGDSPDMQMDDEDGHVDGGHVQRMLQSLENTVRGLSNKLKSSTQIGGGFESS